MIEGKFVARKTSDDPIIYRVSFDVGTGFLEVGSISRQQRHTGHQDIYWRWRVDTFPFAKGDPDGEVCATSLRRDFAMTFPLASQSTVRKIAQIPTVDNGGNAA